MMFRPGDARRTIAALAAFLVFLSAYVPAAAQIAPLVVSVSVSGNTHVPTERILSVVKTKVGEPFNEATVREDLQSIFDLGYFADQVPPEIRQRPGGIAITFRVIENPVVQRITFSGNDHVPSDTLLALMDTAPGQTLNTNTFHQDVLKINSYYDKIGYAGQLSTHVTGINISKDGLLSLNIREGLTVAHIVIKGDHVLPDALIKNALSLKEGQPYSEEVRDKDFENIKKLYEKADLQVGDFEAGIDPSSVDIDKGTADVIYTISAARVGAVEITGNTKTHDDVIRRQLRLRPGQLITQAGLRRDYDRLNNLGYFEKVELNPKPGPDPKRPAEVTLDWNVKEQRTGTAQIGAGYSGGPTGEGLTGTLSYSENNINGTGNGASVRFERGQQISDASITATVPYLGNTPATQKYSLSTSIFAQSTTNYYDTYAASFASSVAPLPIISTPSPGGGNGGGGTIPVTLQPNSNLINGHLANYGTSSIGVSGVLGRRLNDYLTASAGLGFQRLATDVGLDTGYFLAGTQPVSFSNPETNTPFGTTNSGNPLGVVASSIANTQNGKRYDLTSLTFGVAANTEDDVFNPRHGVKASLTEEVSPVPVSAFGYTITTFDGAKFYPVLSNATIGFHALYGMSTGQVPANKLFVLTDQQIRGYSEVFYGTEEILLQSELRVPLTPDKKFGLAFFGDYGSERIRGAQPIVDQFNNVVINYDNWIYHSDVGVGLRFDLPQLGFRSIRLDFAKGANGTHTSFGVGQSF